MFACKHRKPVGFCKECEKERVSAVRLSAGLSCDDCEQVKPDVKKTTCPYAEEINDSIVECQLCDDCYHERCMDI